jgi:hypothetical protein
MRAVVLGLGLGLLAALGAPSVPDALFVGLLVLALECRLGAFEAWRLRGTVAFCHSLPNWSPGGGLVGLALAAPAAWGVIAAVATCRALGLMGWVL